MKRLELTLAVTPVGALDLAPLNPAALAAKTLDQIRRLRLRHGTRAQALGDLFAVNGEAGDALALRGLTASCHHLGRGLESGLIEASGTAGSGLGAAMRGGVIRLRGSAGDGVGLGMRGGLIRIQGDAGDRVGGALPGATHGMNEGTIVIVGTAGARVGERMRRGLILIGGDCGAHLGDRMIAGTIVVLGQAGAQAGLGMRRGTLLLASPPARLPDTFNACGSFRLGIVPLIARHVAQFERRYGRAVERFEYADRWSGDLAHGGKGEILIARTAETTKTS